MPEAKKTIIQRLIIQHACQQEVAMMQWLFIPKQAHSVATNFQQTMA
jgi:hypothetical protein